MNVMCFSELTFEFPNLVELWMNKNKITNLTFGKITGKGPSLSEFVWRSHSVSINHISGNWPSLDRFSILRNDLVELPILTCVLPKLRELGLGHNKISFIREGRKRISLRVKLGTNLTFLSFNSVKL